MSNIIFKGQQNNHPITSNFGEKRDYEPYNGKGHEGIDYKNKKSTPIYCEINGITTNIEYQPDVYGNKITIITNLGYLTKELDGCIIYQIYGHLFKISNKVSIGKLIQAGNVIGQMGNSGYCLYNKNGNWVRVSEEQAKDPKFEPGVHLHLTFYTGLKNRYLTNFIKKKLNLTNKNFFYLEQWNRLYLNPEYFFKFLASY